MIDTNRSLWLKAIATLALCALAAAWTPDVAAQSGPSKIDTKVLKGRQVNETNLVDTLTPDEPEVLTRGLKVSRDATAAVPARRPSASLLITFETNSATLTRSSREQLDVLASALKNDRLKPFTFVVEGHADPRGTTDYNLVLSRSRAESVREYLVAAHQIEPDRLTPVGKGDSEQLNVRDIAAPENRRVTIVTNAQ
jgi:outer membrane protein OmpA-like peptidoglycan-associated protein